MGNLHQVCLTSLHTILQHCPTQAALGTRFPMASPHTAWHAESWRYPQLHAMKVPLPWAATQPSHCFELRKHRRNVDRVLKPQLHCMEPGAGLRQACCDLDVVTVLWPRAVRAQPLALAGWGSDHT